MGHMHAVNCGNPACDICYPDIPDILDALNADDYRLGQVQCVPYSFVPSVYSPLFSEDFLSRLYFQMKSARILERCFCGMTNLNHDTVVSYLANKPMVVSGRWSDGDALFAPVAFGFIVTWVGVSPPAVGPRSAFAAYALLPEVWGHRDGEIAAMLGLARMLRSYKLDSIFGQRTIYNSLTAKFMARFGFRDIATVPQFILDRNREGNLTMADCVISRLWRDDFSRHVENRLIEIAAEQRP